MNDIVTRRHLLLYGWGNDVTYLYNEGDECIDVGGAWQIVDWRAVADTYFGARYPSTNTSNIIKNSSNINLFAKNASTTNWYSIPTIYKELPVDLSPYTKLVIKMQVNTLSGGGGWLGRWILANSIPTNRVRTWAFQSSSYLYGQAADIQEGETGIYIKEIDISNINTSAYIVYYDQIGNGYAMTVDESLLQMWLE